MKKIILNTDGGARGNPGVAGVGAAIFDEEGKVLATTSKPLGIATNNEAEYQAVIAGLDLVRETFGADKLNNLEIELRLDSELIARQLEGKYKVKEDRLRVFHTLIGEMRQKEFLTLKITEVRREHNKLADELANEAMDEAKTSV
jgi:ribonuclease HI